jgi:predicted solute-binding protein
MVTDKLVADSEVLHDVFQNIQKAAESGIKMHQEMFRQWSHLWPLPVPQSIWIERIRALHRQWANMISDLARKHCEVMERQYQAFLDVSTASTPEEFRRRTEELCRKTVDCMREVSHAQLREFQDIVGKLTELTTKIGH